MAAPNVLALQAPAVVACPNWCSGAHVPTEGTGAMHISAEQAVTATSGDERADIYVSVERIDTPGQALEVTTVRLDGHGPMTPGQALHLAAVLQAAAFGALNDVARGGPR